MQYLKSLKLTYYHVRKGYQGFGYLEPKYCRYRIHYIKQSHHSKLLKAAVALLYEVYRLDDLRYETTTSKETSGITRFLLFRTIQAADPRPNKVNRDLNGSSRTAAQSAHLSSFHYG